MNPLLLVMAGGAVGSAGRYLVGRAALGALGPAWPFGTLAVNIIGGLAMGVLAGLLTRTGSTNEQWRLLIGVGVLGGFTTFSSFSLEVVTMLQRGALASALAYVLISVVGALVALYAGLVIVRVAA